MPVDRLPVHLNREKLHDVEVPDTFETTGTFDLRLVNHGAAVHVHLNLDDSLSEVATIDAGNHFIDGESERAVRITVDDPGPARGRLKVASGYGAQTRYVEIKIVKPDEEEEPVQVDESLSQPQPADDTDESAGLLDALPSAPTVVLALGILAVGLAAVAVLVLENTLVLLGALAVVVGVLVAMFFLVAGA